MCGIDTDLRDILHGYHVHELAHAALLANQGHATLAERCKAQARRIRDALAGHGAVDLATALDREAACAP